MGWLYGHVTQPLIREDLLEFGVDISSEQVNRILTEQKDAFYLEKEGVLSAGLEVSDYINVDDTGARHACKNGYCTHIGNEFFAMSESLRRARCSAVFDDEPCIASISHERLIWERAQA